MNPQITPITLIMEADRKRVVGSSGFVLTQSA
jgi:hypothetical protein